MQGILQQFYGHQFIEIVLHCARFRVYGYIAFILARLDKTDPYFYKGCAGNVRKEGGKPYIIVQKVGICLDNAFSAAAARRPQCIHFPL